MESIKEWFNENKFYDMKNLWKKDIDVIKKRLLVLNEIINMWNVLNINKYVFEIAKEIMLKYKLDTMRVILI